jgi:hypothetical protein
MPSSPVTESSPVITRGLGVVAVLFAAATAVVKIRSEDFFWHLAAGREMLTSGQLLRLDPFRFTHQGIEWVDHEWAFQLLLAWIDRLGGLGALSFVLPVFLAAAAALVYGGSRQRGAPAAVALVLVLVFLLGLRGRLYARPEIATLVFFLGLLTLLKLRVERGQRGFSLAVLALAAVWANFHPGVLALPPIAGVFLAAARLEDKFTRRAPRVGWPEVFGLPAAALVAICANPWGWEVFFVPSRIAEALSGLPATNPDWAPIWQRPQPLLFAALIGLAGLLFFAYRRAGRFDWPGFAVVASLLPLVASSVRHQGLLWGAGSLLAASCLGELNRQADGPGFWTRRRGVITALAALVLVGGLLVLAPGVLPGSGSETFGVGIVPGLFPEAALAELERFEPVGNLFNSPAFGGYILWRNYPPRKIFYDTRNEVDPGILRTLAAARADAGRWQALLNRHQIDAALVAFEDRPRRVLAPPDEPGGGETVEIRTSSALYFPPEGFALVFWDDRSMLFLARTTERAGTLAANEYRVVQPEDWRHWLPQAQADPALFAQARAELERKLAQDPRCQRARALLGLLLENANRPLPSH